MNYTYLTPIRTFISEPLDLVAGHTLVPTKLPKLITNAVFRDYQKLEPLIVNILNSTHKLDYLNAHWSKITEVISVLNPDYIPVDNCL